MNRRRDAASFRALSFAALGCVARVRYQSGVESWPERLCALMGAPTWHDDSLRQSVQQPAVSLTVIRMQRESHWRIQQRKRLAQQPFAWYHEDALLRDVEWRLYAASAAESPKQLVLHAGAVARDGMALLLPGVSGAGKTTLTYALAARGWQTLTDDLLALDGPPYDSGGEMLALPCERCGHISPRTLELLAEIGVALEGPVAGLMGYHRPREWGGAAPVRYVIVPQYQPDAECAATLQTQAETAALLMKARFFQRHVDYHRQWQAAIRAAAQTRCWRLTYGSLNDALDRVEQLTTVRAERGESGETQERGKE